MKKIIVLLIICAPLLSMAQQPKMHLKAFGGTNSNTFVYKTEGVDSDLLLGWQAGLGARVMHRRAFLEADIVYRNYGITINPNEDAAIDDIEEPIDIRMKALEFPLTMGWVAVKEPIFKWFLYGGLVSRFSLKGKYTYQGEDNSFKPSELDLRIYNLGARFGTQFDLAMFNFDFNYTIGVTNTFKAKARTNSHGLELSVGLLF